MPHESADALLAGYRPAVTPFMTAIVTFADAGNGKTAYKAVALHKDVKDRDTHEQMGFQDGWGTTAQQLEKFAKTLRVNA